MYHALKPFQCCSGVPAKGPATAQSGCDVLRLSWGRLALDLTVEQEYS